MFDWHLSVVFLFIWDVFYQQIYDKTSPKYNYFACINNKSCEAKNPWRSECALHCKSYLCCSFTLPPRWIVAGAGSPFLLPLWMIERPIVDQVSEDREEEEKDRPLCRPVATVTSDSINLALFGHQTFGFVGEELLRRLGQYTFLICWVFVNKDMTQNM